MAFVITNSKYKIVLCVCLALILFNISICSNFVNHTYGTIFTNQNGKNLGGVLKSNVTISRTAEVITEYNVPTNASLKTEIIDDYFKIIPIPSENQETPSKKQDVHVVDSKFPIKEDTFDIIPILGEIQEKPSKKQALPVPDSKLPMKYIFKWGSNKHGNNLNELKIGQASFIENECEYTNCYVADEDNIIANIPIHKFDAVLFNVKSVTANEAHVPVIRSQKQKYVFVSTEPANVNMVFDKAYDNFFNWTWTYRLDSDVLWRYITIYDLDGNLVGPHPATDWPDEMKPIDQMLRLKLSRKNVSAVWINQDCTGYKRKFADTIGLNLEQFGHQLIYLGECNHFNKSLVDTDSQLTFHLRKEIYFHLCFENNLDVDFITDRLLLALENYAVPIVFGDPVDYSRYLPFDSYLNAQTLGVDELTNTMLRLMENHTAYSDFFRWRNHFRYKSNRYTKELCNICEALNDVSKVRETTVYDDFRYWWNGANRDTNWTELYETVIRYLGVKSYAGELVQRVANKLS